DEGVEALRHLVPAHSLEAVRGDGGDGGIDAPHGIGTAGGGVLVGRLVQAPDCELDRRAAVEAVAIAELDGGASVAAAGARGVEVVLLVAPAGDVVLENAARPAAEVVAGEDRHHGQALHGHGQV